MLERTKNDTIKTSELLEYVTHYSDPSAIVQNFSKDLTFGEVKD